MTRLFGCVCGQFHSPGAGMGLAAERVTVPIPFYVIEHPDGVALFDAGLHDDMQAAEDPYRQQLRRQGMDVSLTAEETVAHHLERLEIDAEKVRYVVLSHLHFDHAGGLNRLPNATLVVQSREWAAGADDETARRYFLPKRFFDLGHEVRLVDGEHDLFGDGSVTCLPSHGHTPGHQSLRVRSAQGDHILVGDACYTAEAAMNRTFPAFADQAAMNQALDALLARRDRDTVVIYGHDPGQWGDKALLPSVRP
ncbi:N-acyl homoserine lactonase family protein [Phenylobacterium kunshanense]|uniref:N-acyl homoserine lactonase family protein n=1 Tax=Phenylobacterium kunshanense TaxID=1445034 RepID=A0A328BG73_9CAUL|nr:N-acyl homoserine lactonase family protein [Phenylobacterium kunshanense]RAK66502.1 N-acyl homoserine lactonase family protein [Phenylobacterium kunshanense]